MTQHMAAQVVPAFILGQRVLVFMAAQAVAAPVALTGQVYLVEMEEAELMRARPPALPPAVVGEAAILLQAAQVLVASSAFLELSDGTFCNH